MIGAYLCQAIQEAAQTAFPGVYVGLAQDNERITLPAITLQLRATSVVGSRLERGTLTVNVASQADDSTPAEHAAFVESVGDFMRTLTVSTDKVYLAGLVSTDSDEMHAERHWQTPLTYIVGFTPSIL